MSLTKEVLNFVKMHKDADVTKLLLSKQDLEGDVLKYAIQQIAGRQYAQSKLPSWSEKDTLEYPIHLSLEQCSSELTARYKAEIVPKGKSFIDLTGGFGVDCAFISNSYISSTYVERNKELKNIVAYNYKQLGLESIECKCADAVTYLEHVEPVDTIFIDPARRGTDGSKLVSIGDCEPNVLDLLSLFKLKCRYLIIKLSPMLDISLALRELPLNVDSVHVVSVHNECKELLFVIDFHKSCILPKIHCINLLDLNSRDSYTFNLALEEAVDVCYTDKLLDYLYEPNSSILKAGAFNSLAVTNSLLKLHVNSHLYTSSDLIERFPGRKFKVNGVYSFDKKSIKELKSKIDQANITIRNFPSSVDALRKRLKLKDGGAAYLFATTLLKDKKVLIHCNKIV